VKRVRIAAWLAVAFALGVIAWPLTSFLLHKEEKFDALFIGGPFAMTDHNGRAVTEKDYAGKAKAIFFGFILPGRLPDNSGAAHRVDGKTRPRC
jgi:protein SCO1/2